MTNQPDRTPRIDCIDALEGGGAYIEGYAHDADPADRWFCIETDDDAETVALLLGFGFTPDEIATAAHAESDPH